MRKLFFIALVCCGVAFAVGYSFRQHRENLPDPRRAGEEIEAVMRDPDLGLVVTSRMPALIERDKQNWSVLTLENQGTKPASLVVYALGIMIRDVSGGKEKRLMEENFLPQLPYEITLKPREKISWKMSWVLADYEGAKAAGYLKCEYQGFVLPPGVNRLEMYFSFFNREDVDGKRVSRKTLVSSGLFLNLRHGWWERNKVSRIEVTAKGEP